MKTSLTKIGNSKGIIIPSHLLKECEFDNIIDMQIKDNSIVLSKPVKARTGWGDAFAKALNDNNELLLDDNISNEFDEKEWQW